MSDPILAVRNEEVERLCERLSSVYAGTEGETKVRPAKAEDLEDLCLAMDRCQTRWRKNPNNNAAVSFLQTKRSIPKPLLRESRLNVLKKKKSSLIRKSKLNVNKTRRWMTIDSKPEENDSTEVESATEVEPPSYSQAAPISHDVTDVEVDNLAAYFEYHIHLPKKMSFMAEMMYT